MFYRRPHHPLSLIAALLIALFAPRLGAAPPAAGSDAVAPRVTPRAAWRAASPNTLRLRAFTLTRTVEQRRPGPAVGVVPLDGGRVYAHLELLYKGEAGTTCTVTTVWKRNGVEQHRYTLKVGRSPAWRTWSYLTAARGRAGTWSVAVLDAAGTLLGEQFVLLQARPGQK